MALIHPTTPLSGPLNSGDYRERDVLRLLADGLPDSFDVFHNLPWSSIHQGTQHFGELDLVVISPVGHVMLIEVKAGSINEGTSALTKTYGGIGSDKDIGHQVRRQHSTLMQRMKDGDLPNVNIDTLLVLPDHAVLSAVLAYPRERIVDAPELDTLCQRVMRAFPSNAPACDVRTRVFDFFANRFQVVTDVASSISQVQQLSTTLASGLATWVPKISHTGNLFVVQATAGSGKTQLALKLLQDAVKAKQRSCYVCYNRPLADHLAKLAPAAVDVTTFHQLCRDLAERQGEKPDFADPSVFSKMVSDYVEASESFSKSLDLLIIDESQDFEPTWAQALLERLKDTGRLYVMGDTGQQLYERDMFDLTDAVHIKCMDNFRSPTKVVQMINALGLSEEPVVARSVHTGETPHIYTWAPGQVNSLTALDQCLKKIWQNGYNPEQVAVISYHGAKTSEVLGLEELGGFKTKRFSKYDDVGNALWTDGDLLVESVYRFKGQSMPVVVLCEVDFKDLTEKDKRKLFVGLTRGQVRADIVISEESAIQLMHTKL
nr:AAA family ATPase [uncultured Limnohabitans sp.]